MASEITVPTSQAVVTLDNSGLKKRWEVPSLSVTQTLKEAIENTQSIPTTAAGTAVTMTNITTAGWAFFRNTDPVNYVQVGVQVGGVFYAFVKLKAGEWCLLRLGTNAPYARANTAAVPLDARHTRPSSCRTARAHSGRRGQGGGTARPFSRRPRRPTHRRDRDSGIRCAHHER